MTSVAPTNVVTTKGCDKVFFRKTFRVIEIEESRGARSLREQSDDEYDKND